MTHVADAIAGPDYVSGGELPMAQQHKVRLAGGIEVGPVDLDTLRAWYEQGTLRKDSMVLPLGSRSWTRLMDAVKIERWQMPAASAHHGPRPVSRPRAQAQEASPPQVWRTVVAACLLLAAAAGAGFFAFFPERWLAALRPAPWREIALGFLAMGLALVRGWELTRKLVRALMLLLTLGIFPLALILWLEGLSGEALLVLASALPLGSGFFALLSGSRLSALATAARVLLVLAGAAGIAYFGLLA